jgi:hypothetical protein
MFKNEKRKKAFKGITGSDAFYKRNKIQVEETSMNKLVKADLQPNKNIVEYQDEIVNYFLAHPHASDMEVHAWARSLGLSPSKLEGEIYKLFSSMLANVGKHNHVPDAYFDAVQLDLGTKVEMEHTHNPDVAKMIAKDHLMELPDYYNHLLRMETDAKNTHESNGIGSPEDNELTEATEMSRLADMVIASAKTRLEETAKRSKNFHPIKEGHEGLLHEQMHVAEDKKIPVNKLKKAAHSKNKKLAKRANFALNARKWKKKGNKKD